jgi:hypothetical protein
MEDVRRITRKSAALEANELSKIFYSEQYRHSRDLAYSLLHWLNDKPDERLALARMWILDDDWIVSAPLAAYIQAQSAFLDPPPTTSEGRLRAKRQLSWAISNVLDFYVRLHTHIDSSKAICATAMGA